MNKELIVKRGVIIKGNLSGSTVLDIQGTQGQLFSITDNLVGEIFSINDISGIPIMSVNSNGNVTIDGNLTAIKYRGFIEGIDNTPAKALLQSGAGRADDESGSTWLFLDSAGGTSNPWGIKHNQLGNFIEFYGSGSLKTSINLGTGSINSGELISGKLDITGTPAVVSLNANSTSTAAFRTAGHVQMAIATEPSWPYATTLQAKHSNDDGSTYPIALNPLGGNVGIGTTAPQKRLHIESDNNNQLYLTGGLHGSGNQYASIGFSDAGDNAFNFVSGYGGGNNNIITFTIGGGECVRFKQNGYVGISTTSPSEKFSVVGNIAFGNTEGKAKMIYNSTEVSIDFIIN